jgi:hypothetical protein
MQIARTIPTAWVAVAAENVRATVEVYAIAGLGGATVDAGGSFVFTLYSDASCQRRLADAGTAAVDGNTIDPSGSFSFPKAGTYYIQGVYSGDANNLSNATRCLSVSVADPPPTAKPTPRPTLPPTNQVGPTALCRDGTYSYSANHSGTCSWHGGVAVWYR